MAKEWKIIIIGKSSISDLTHEKRKQKAATAHDNTSATIEEVVEIRLNDMSAEGWDVYECKIVSREFARVIFFREKPLPNRD